VPDLAGPHRIDGLKEFNNDGQQIRHPVRWSVDHHHAEGEIGEVLLVLDVSIHRDEDIAHVAGALRSAPFWVPAQPRP